eukprot:COSAG05_NODE_3766_length_1848_cov_1.666667_2_plen_211_part_00
MQQQEHHIDVIWRARLVQQQSTLRKKHISTTTATGSLLYRNVPEVCDVAGSLSADSEAPSPDELHHSPAALCHCKSREANGHGQVRNVNHRTNAPFTSSIADASTASCSATAATVGSCKPNPDKRNQARSIKVLRRVRVYDAPACIAALPARPQRGTDVARHCQSRAGAGWGERLGTTPPDHARGRPQLQPQFPAFQRIRICKYKSSTHC